MLADVEVPNWSQVIIPLGVAGILGWYLWYTTTTTFPKISTDHLNRIDLICQKQAESQKEIVKTFTEELEKEREARKEALQLLASTFKCPMIGSIEKGKS